jgi:hypothetical protein
MTDGTSPTAQRAHALVARAIKRGELTRQPCEVCGDEYAEAHHSNYDLPLNVRWLCSKHHHQLHGRARRRELSEKAGWGDDFLGTQEAANLIGLRPEDLYAFHDKLETVSNLRDRIYRASSVEKLIELLDRDLDVVLAAQQEAAV